MISDAFTCKSLLGYEPFKTCYSFQVLRVFSAPRQFMETFQELCRVEENNKVCGVRCCSIMLMMTVVVFASVWRSMLCTM